MPNLFPSNGAAISSEAAEQSAQTKEHGVARVRHEPIKSLAIIVLNINSNVDLLLSLGCFGFYQVSAEGFTETIKRPFRIAREVDILQDAQPERDD